MSDLLKGMGHVSFVFVSPTPCLVPETESVLIESVLNERKNS